MAKTCYVPSEANDKLVDKIVQLLKSEFGIKGADRAYVTSYLEELPDGFELEDNEESINSLAVSISEDYYRKIDTPSHRYDATNPEGSNYYQDLLKAVISLKEARKSSSRTIYEDVDLIMYEFSKLLDFYAKAYKVSRVEVANGFKIGNSFYGGEFALFEIIHNRISSMAENATGTLKIRYKQLLRNWGALVLFSKIKLSTTENLKLGNATNFALASQALDDLEEILDEEGEESLKDPVDKIKDEEIPDFKRLGQITRYFLGRVPKFIKQENGEYVEARNIYGVPIMEDPHAMHRALKTVFRGIRSKQDIVKRLQRVSGNPTYKYILNELYTPLRYYEACRTKDFSGFTEEELQRCRKADQYLQCLYLDYNKVFLIFSKIKSSIRKLGDRFSPKIYESVILNRTQSAAETVYLANLNNHVANNNTLYDKDGNLREDKWKKFVECISNINNYREKSIDRDARKDIVQNLYTVSKMMGMDISRPILQSALQDTRGLRRILTNVGFIKDYVVKYVDNLQTSTADIAAIKDGKIPYSMIYTHSEGGNFKKSLMERLAISILRQYTMYDLNSTFMEPSVLTMNAKGDYVRLFSDTNPAYLSKFIEALQNFAREGDSKGLRDYIDSLFGNNPAFCDMEIAKKEKELKSLSTRKFRIEWLNSLYNSNMDNVWSFINNISLTRSLGFQEDNIPFENVSQKGHLQMLLTDFLQIERMRGKGLARYPVFISGDANQYKVITAKVYEREELINSLVNLFYYERQLQAQIRGIEESMARKLIPEKVFNKINNLINTTPKDSALPFYKDPAVLSALIEEFHNEEGLEGDEEGFISILLDNIFADEHIQDTKNLTDEKLKEIIQNYFKSYTLEAHDDNMFYLMPCFNEIFKDKNIEQLTKEQVKDIINEAFTIGKNSQFEDFKKLCLYHGIIEERTKKGSNETYLTFANFTKDVTRDLKGSKVEDKLYSFWLNNKVAMAQQIALMTISPSFYINLKDMQKRYKETHSSGQMLDLEALWEDNFIEVNTDNTITQSVLYIKEATININKTNPLFMNVVRGKIGDRAKAYEKTDCTDGQAYRTIESYRKIAIATHQWTKENEAFYQELLSIRRKYGDGVSAVDVDLLSKEQKEQYIKDLKHLLKSDIIMQPIKPFLFTHEKYGIEGKGDIQGKIPVQIKSSECVLIPELLNENSRTRHIAEYMTDNSIDLVAFTSCVKVGAWGAVDIRELKNKEEMNTALSKAFIHKLDSKDYLIQVNVPPHEYQNRLFATQIRKLILGGTYDATFDYFKGKVPALIRGNLKYLPKELNESVLKDFYNSLLVSNFIDSLKTFISDTKNLREVVNLLIREGLHNDRTSLDALTGLVLEGKSTDTDEWLTSLIDASESADEGKLRLALCEAIREPEVVNTLISHYKKIVNKQSIYGGSAVQATSYGLQGYEESSNLKMITDVQYEQENGVYKRDENGNFIPIPGTATNVLYAEVEIPLMHKWIDTKGNEHVIDYDTFVNYDGTLKYDEDQYEEWNGKKVLKFGAEPLIDKIYPGLRDFVAYRIPTERAYSMINCKAVRFTRPNSGITIRVPSECVTMAGFDFDIDKLFFMFKKFVEAKHRSSDGGRWKTYNFDLTPEENDKDARDNILIEIIRQRLMDKNTLAERVTPGGFFNAQEAAEDMMQLFYNKEAFAGKNNITRDDTKTARNQYKENHPEKPDVEPEYDYTELGTLLLLNERNQLAAKLIGIAANQNTNHVYCSGLKTLKLKNSIAFGLHNEDGLSDLIHCEVPGMDTFLTTAEILAASVDAVKKPVLGYLNLNTLTINAAFVLARLGYDFFDIGLLLNQPVIKKLCEKATVGNRSINSVINNFMTEVASTKDISDLEEGHPSRNDLIQSILNDDDITSTNQLEVLKLFSSILKVSNELNTIVTKTKFTAANAVSPTFGNFYALQGNLNKFKEFQYIEVETTDEQKEPIVDDNEINIYDVRRYLGSLAGNSMAFEQGMYDVMKYAMKHLMKYFPYESSVYKKLRNLFSFYSLFYTLDEKTINYIHKEFPVYLLNSMNNGIFNGDSIMDITESGVITNREYFEKIFPQELADFLAAHPELRDSPIFQGIQFEYVTEGNETSLVIKVDFSALPQDKWSKDLLIDSWSNLANDTSTNAKAYKDMAVKLFLFNYYKTGFNFTTSSFITYAPTALKLSMNIIKNEEGEPPYTYAQFWEDLISCKEASLPEDYIYQYFIQHILNHIENSKFVTNVYGALRDILDSKSLFSSTVEEGTTSRRVWNDEVTLNVDSFTEDQLEALNNIVKAIRDEDNNISYVFSPCLAFTDDVSGEKIYYVLESIPTDASGNLTGSNVITYVRAAPIGITNISMNYGTDWQTLDPIEDYEDNDNTEKLGGTEDPTGQIPTQGASKANFHDRVASLIQGLSDFIEELQKVSGQHIDIEAEEYNDLRQNILLSEDKKARLEDIKNIIKEAQEYVGISTVSGKAASLKEKLLNDISEAINTLDAHGNETTVC